IAPRVLGDRGFGLGAVRQPRRVAEVEDRFARQARTQRPDHGEPADAGVEDADWRIGAGRRGHCGGLVGGAAAEVSTAAGRASNEVSGASGRLVSRWPPKLSSCEPFQSSTTRLAPSTLSAIESTRL